jgi:hypothetical protein
MTQALDPLVERMKIIAEEIQERSFDPYCQRARDVWNGAATITRLTAERDALRGALDLTTMLLKEMRATLNDAGQVGPVSIIDNVLAKAATLKDSEQ